MREWEGMALTVLHVPAYRPRKMNQVDRNKALLEEEIRQLRGRMEDVARSEQSFTSETVIQLSMLMDEKINQYIAFMNNLKSK